MRRAELIEIIIEIIVVIAAATYLVYYEFHPATPVDTYCDPVPAECG